MKGSSMSKHKKSFTLEPRHVHEQKRIEDIMQVMWNCSKKKRSAKKAWVKELHDLVGNNLKKH
jgi:hypothetical protein